MAVAMRDIPPRKPLTSLITVDVIVKVVNNSIFHPFIAWLIPLCIRALDKPADDPGYIGSCIWAAIITIYNIFKLIDDRIAYGLPREVDLSEEVIVITGGASGLGLLIAEVYGMRSASVAVLDVKPVENAESKGIKYYECDVGDAVQVAKVAKQIEEDLGTPTILINNAGIVHAKSILDLNPEDIDRSLRTNLHSHYHTLRTFLPGILRSENGGTIVTLSSTLAHLGCSHLSTYTASKAALLALHASLRAELSHFSSPAYEKQYPGAKYIKTLLVSPGQLATPLFDGLKTPSSFLAPVLEPVEVAKEIIRMVERGEGGEIVTPFYSKWVPWMTVLSPGVRDLLIRWSGRDKAIFNFVESKKRV
ncbi:NAD(P)-binding protein [Patellaria atrata CBS 101060]|uniref:NAD(P)-binding protein n=1 Tax=Patellaria atrata CBS 101060 TaxID=1346257 RepID=A0A9P4SC98_9PEZI|nr:NAD(P)-binding protein [Patellaria atrata CBS 101060]